MGWPVFYSTDDGRSLYWVSGKDALHSANVRAGPHVAIVVSESPDQAVDAIQVTATELNEEAEVKAGRT